MADVFDIDPLAKYMAMFVGGNGSGKSVAIASWLRKGPIYTFDFDGRMASVANWYKQRGLRPGQLTYDTYGPGNLYEAHQKMESLLNNCPYAAVSIDSFSSATISAVMYSLRKRGRMGDKKVSMTKGEMIIPDWDEYKGETVFITQFLDMCKDLAAKGVAVFWTAHPIESTKIDGKNYSVQTRYVAYGHKVDSLVPIYFNEIYHFVTENNLQADKVERIVYTQPMGGVNAKTALNLPTKINWTDQDFYSVLSNLAREGQEEANKRGEEYIANNPVEEKPNKFSL